MPTEIERKFLVTDESWREAVVTQASFVQAYLLTGTDRSLRVRIENDNRAMICLKIGPSSLSREEFEYPVPLNDARDMVARAEGVVLQKTRHLIHYRGYIWEVDTYHGIYDGLTVAEVEMESVDEQPPLPAWAGQEITGDTRYSNASLATNNLSGDLVR